MDDDILDEELSIMYEESMRPRVLDATTFQTPIKNLRVRKPFTLSIERSAQDALVMMQQQQTSCILITEREKLSGIVTERDIVRKGLASDKGLSEIPLSEIMSKDPQAFQPEDSIAFVLNAMHTGGYRHVPVVDEQYHPIATVSVRDLVAFIVDNFTDEVVNLPPKPMRTTQEREGA